MFSGWKRLKTKSSLRKEGNFQNDCVWYLFFLYIIAHIHVWCICYDKSVYLKVNPTSYNDVFKKLSNWTTYMHTNFLTKPKWLGRWRWHFGVTLESYWEILFLTLVCLSVSSPDSDGIPSGVDHGSTWAMSGSMMRPQTQLWPRLPRSCGHTFI